MQPATDPVAEGARLMVICNACRYCEGFCAVFPAMERRLHFGEADMNYLANLCHNCAECLYACQYAPPHEFAVNVPQVLAQIRGRSYRKYAWPGFGPLSGLWAVVAGIAVAAVIAGMRSAAGGNFYGVIPHETMVGTFTVVFAFAVAVNIAGLVRFWRESGESVDDFFRPAVLWSAFRDALTLKNMASNGVGCTYPDEKHSQSRRWCHHLTFYGFMLCAASTTVAAIYHSFFGWEAPHPYFSVPVVLGTLGGAGLIIGPAGLYWLKRHRDTAIVDTRQDGMDFSFLAMLFLTSLSGLLLLGLRETSAMGVLLRIHLALVFGLFLTLPYGKFVHGIYRSAALVRSSLEASRSQL